MSNAVLVCALVLAERPDGNLNADHRLLGSMSSMISVVRRCDGDPIILKRLSSGWCLHSWRSAPGWVAGRPDRGGPG